MTTINKITTRVTRDQYRVLHHRRPRNICVSLCVGDYIEFREKGRRGRWTLPIDAAFIIAVKMQVEADRRKKREERRAA